MPLWAWSLFCAYTIWCTWTIIRTAWVLHRQETKEKKE